MTMSIEPTFNLKGFQCFQVRYGLIKQKPAR